MKQARSISLLFKWDLLNAINETLDFTPTHITYLRAFLVHAPFMDVSRHPKVCNFTRQILSQQDIPSCQVTMNNLSVKKYTSCK